MQVHKRQKEYGMANTRGNQEPESLQTINSVLSERLDTLANFRTTRAEIALLAAQHIAEQQGGETTDPTLFYPAMFGRSWEEGKDGRDPAYIALSSILSLNSPLLRENHQDQPLRIQRADLPVPNRVSPIYPDHIGVLGSFSPEAFQPVKLNVTFNEQKHEESFSWRGSLGIAVRSVIPHPEDTSIYALEEEPSEVTVCHIHASLWRGQPLDTFSQDIVSSVVTGRMVHANSRRFRGEETLEAEKRAIWLGDFLAPTEAKSFSEEKHGSFRQSARRARQESMSEGGAPSEAVAAARGLSPTERSYFTKILKLSVDDEGNAQPIDIPTLFTADSDPYRAQDEIFNLEVIELLERDPEDRLVVSKLGLEARHHLNDD
jgi:hypothetical protein